MPEPWETERTHLSAEEVAQLTAAVRALPDEITRGLRASPLSVKEAKSKWRKRLALAGTIAAAGSGTYALVSNITQPTVVQQVAPISQTAARLNHGLTRYDAFWARVKADYRNLRADLASGGSPATGGTQASGRRVIHLGKAFTISLDRTTNPARETRRLLREWQGASPNRP